MLWWGFDGCLLCQAKKEAKPADPYREKKLNLSSKLRDIIGFHRNDPTTPNPATKALETAVSSANCP